jgi:pimeloyl-ACP methyl ester carboxylesterase
MGQEHATPTGDSHARRKSTIDCTLSASDDESNARESRGSAGYIVAAVTGYHANATGVGGWNVPYPMVQVQNNRGGGRRWWWRVGGGQCQPSDARRFSARRNGCALCRGFDGEGIQRRPESDLSDGQLLGGSAVWNIAAKFPERWTAISPSAATLDDAMFPYEKLKTVPVLVVHGDMDTTMVFDASKVMVDHAKAKGVDATWLPVPGGAHTDAWAQPEILNKTFDFFDAHKARSK